MQIQPSWEKLIEPLFGRENTLAVLHYPSKGKTQREKPKQDGWTRCHKKGERLHLYGWFQGATVPLYSGFSHAEMEMVRSKFKQNVASGGKPTPGVFTIINLPEIKFPGSITNERK